MKRTLALCAVIVCALVAAFAATRARRLGLRVESFAVTPGGSADNAPSLGDDLPFAPFRFAVVESVQGDHAALGRAMDGIRDRGGADFVVLTGDVLGGGSEMECRKLAAACRDRGMEVVAVPGPRDLDADRIDQFRKWMNGERWWFEHRHVRFNGAVTDAEALDLIRAANPSSIETRQVVLSVIATPSTDRPAYDFLCGIRRSEQVVSVRVYNVLDDHAFSRAPSAGKDLRDPSVAFDVPRAAGLASLWRDATLGILYPLVETKTRYDVFVLACAVIVALAITRLRRARPAAPPGTDVRTPS